MWLSGAALIPKIPSPLDSVERLLSTAGLVLIVLGILALGIRGLRARRV